MSNPLLVVEDLSVRFGGLSALDRVSFELKPGEILGIIGPNGAGKTTLFNSLVGVQRLTEGRITFDGVRIENQMPHRVTRAGMTKTFQNAALFPDMSVRENVTTAALVHHGLEEARHVADEALKRLNLTSIGDTDVSILTFPQKALVELARATATQSRVLLLDEVMAALTHTEMDEVMDVVKRLRSEGLTFIVVEHHMRAMMSLCDRLLALTFGRLIAEGTPREVVRHPEVIRAYLGSSVVKEAEHA